MRINPYEKRLTQAYNQFAKGRGPLPVLIIKVGRNIFNSFEFRANTTGDAILADHINGGKRYVSAKMYLDETLGPNDFTIGLPNG